MKFSIRTLLIATTILGIACSTIPTWNHWHYLNSDWASIESSGSRNGAHGYPHTPQDFYWQKDCDCKGHQSIRPIDWVWRCRVCGKAWRLVGEEGGESK